MIVLDHVKLILPVLMTPCPFYLSTLTTSSYVILSPNLKVHICIMIQTLVHLKAAVKLLVNVSVSGTKSMKRNQEREMQAAAFLFVSLRRSSNSKYKAQTRCIQSLRQYIAVGFDPNISVVFTLNEGAKQWRYSHAEQWWHQQYTIKHETTSLSSFEIHVYLAYLFELGWDVAIKPSMNVSSNTGFESFIGVLGRLSCCA